LKKWGILPTRYLTVTSIFQLGKSYEKRKFRNKKISLSLAIVLFSFTQLNAAQGTENTMTKKVTQTAGHDVLGKFAKDFAHFNDDVLFGENWNNQDLSLKNRSLITVVALISSGITDSSLKYHLENAKKNGVTQKEIAATITHIAFYAGWPKAWAAFNLSKDIWTDESSEKSEYSQELLEHQQKMIFPVGKFNEAYAKYFTKKSYLAPISTEQVGIYNVTFEPECRNNWHIHHAKKGGGQILIGIAGKGLYKEEGKELKVINPGDVINIPANVKHWHGAAPDGYFSHLAVEVPGEDTRNEWLEVVSDEEYKQELSTLK
jgi:4-carboxymuconolactone decarboxylase